MAGPQCNTSGPNDIVEQPSNTDNSIPITQKQLIKEKPHPITNPYERLGTIIGTYIAIIVGIAIICGAIVVPGGLPVVMALFFGLIGCPKYIGCATDSVIEIKNGKSSNNKKIANLGGCVAGLVIFIISVCCPALTILTSSINALVQATNISVLLKYPALFIGLIGTAAAAADKFGLIVDGFTKLTIVDVYRTLKNKIKSLFVKDNSDSHTNVKSLENDQSIKAPLIPQTSQANAITKKEPKLLNFDTYEKKASVLGLVIAIIIVSLVFAGTIAIPGVGPPLAIGLFIACIGIPKYLGKGFDCMVDKTIPTNQKLGTLIGCFIGLGLGIVAICCPGISLITSSINALVQSSNLTFLEKVPAILFGLAGTVGAAADKIGLLIDCFTNYTLLDACRFVKRKIPIFNKKNNMRDVSDVGQVQIQIKSQENEIPSPQKLPGFTKVDDVVAPLPNPSVPVEFIKETRLSKNPSGFFHNTKFPEDIPELSLAHPNYLEYQPVMVPGQV